MSDALTDEELDAWEARAAASGNFQLVSALGEVRRLRALLTAPPDDDEIERAARVTHARSTDEPWHEDSVVQEMYRADAREGLAAAFAVRAAKYRR